MKEKKNKRRFLISIILIGMYLLILATAYLQMLIQNQSKEVERYLSEMGKIQATYLSYVLEPNQDLELLRKWIEIPMFYEEGYMDIMNQEGEIVLQSHHPNSNQNIKNVFSIKFKNEKAKENLKENLKNKKSRNLTNCFL